MKTMEKKVIHVKHTSIVIPDYEMGQNEKIERMLSVWNPTHFRLENVGFHYNEKTRELILPRGIDTDYLNKEFGLPVQIEREHNPVQSAVYRLKVEPRSDIQRKSISYLLGMDTFAFTRKHSQLTLDLDTGDGKTYVTVAAASFIKEKSMIITHNDNIKEQWRQSFLKMTDINEAHILDISGSDVIRKLLKLRKPPTHKVFLINHQTIQSYAKKEGWDKLNDLFIFLGIGMKVFDEAHLRFTNLMMVDLHTNVKKTIYLTATFERSDFKEDRVYSLCFKNIPVYGRETRTEKRKHIIYMPVFFDSRPNYDDRSHVRGRYGLDKNKYIDYLIGTDIFYNVLLFMINYVDKGEGKLLALFTKNDAIATVQEFLQKEYKGDRTVAVYNSLVSDEDKQTALQSGLILSTPKSLGTGSDIPKLRYNIVTEPYSSTVSAEQYAGRLREYAEDKFTVHIELIDNGFPEVLAMYKKRLKVFKKKCAKIVQINYDDKMLQEVKH